MSMIAISSNVSRGGDTSMVSNSKVMLEMKDSLEHKIVCVVGLGYVGMPLAEAFSKHFKVIGFDINKQKATSFKSRIYIGSRHES